MIALYSVFHEADDFFFMALTCVAKTYSFYSTGCNRQSNKKQIQVFRVFSLVISFFGKLVIFQIFFHYIFLYFTIFYLFIFIHFYLSHKGV